MGPNAVDSREELGRALTELRLAAGLSVRDVAAQADALVGTVAGWFSGQHAPTRANRTMFENVLAACGVDEAGRDVWWAAVERVTRRGGKRRSRPKTPYRGFEPFSPTDDNIFFGRGVLVDRLVELLLAQQQQQAAAQQGQEGVPRYIGAMVVGASGVGKSSLVRAGLLSRVGADGPLRNWRYAVMAPGNSPVAALTAALAELDAPERDGVSERAGDESVAATRPRVLVIDQLEELYTQNDEPTRDEFNERMLAAAADGVVPVGVLRADFYGRFASVPWLSTVLQEAQVVVPPLGLDQLREVIVEPAAVVGASVEDDLVQMLIDDVVAPRGSTATDTVAPGVLPLLSHALRATWEVSDGKRLTVRDYLATGRISGAVEKTAEAVIAELDDGDMRWARSVLLAMVNVDEETITRRTVQLADLGMDAADGEQVHVENARARKVLERFASARLVTIWSTQAQVAHEALLTAWPRLTKWIEADRERLLLQRRLRGFRDPWLANGRPDDLLLVGPRLEMFSQLAGEGAADATTGADGAADLDMASREYLAAGLKRQGAEREVERRRARTLRRVAVFAGVFAVVAVLFAVAAIVAGVNANRESTRADQLRHDALSRQLAVQSAELGDRDPGLAAQLAMVAYRQSPTLEASARLIDSMNRPVPNRFIGLGGALDLAYAASAQLVAVASASRQVRLFRVDDTGIAEQLADLREVAPTVHGVALSSDGRTMFLGGADALSTWDVSDPRAPRRTGELPGVRGAVHKVSISPDGATVVAALPEIGIQAWVRDGGSWRAVGVPPTVAGRPGAVAFSPDGSVLATSTVYGRIDLWEIVDGTLRQIAEIPVTAHNEHSAFALGLTFSRDGRRLFASFRSREIVGYDLTTMRAPREFARFGGFDSYVNAVTLSSDGALIAGASADNTVRVFRVDEPGAQPMILASPGNMSGAVFAGGHIIATSTDGRVQDWLIDDQRTRVGSNTVYQIPANAVADTLLAANTETDGRITQWQVAAEGLRSAGPDVVPPEGEVYSGAVVLSASGRTAAMGTVSGDVHFADYSDPRAPTIVGISAGLSTLNETVDYSEASGVAITGATDHPALVVINAADVAAPRKVAELTTGDGVYWASLSPDGRLAALALVDGSIRLADVSDPASPRLLGEVYKFNGTGLSVRFNSDGTRIAASSGAKDVAVIDISDPEQPQTIATMAGPAGQLYSVGFSADGSKVIAGGSNAEVWIWDLATRTDSGEATVWKVLRSYDGRVYDVRFAVDDSMILAAGAGGVINSWLIDSDALIDAYCARPGDHLTEAEWKIYLPDEPYAPPCRT